MNKQTWTQRRILTLILIWPVTAIAFGLSVHIVNPEWMTNASYGGTSVVTK